MVTRGGEEWPGGEKGGGGEGGEGGDWKGRGEDKMEHGDQTRIPSRSSRRKSMID